ncbi:Fis family transcriptional regulator [Erythrobacter sp. SG61-1L]|nr:Fis family transcriptional regulator [Erythrobacter sp. SG61-1L]
MTRAAASAPEMPVMADLAATLHFSPETGHIWLAGRRMVLMHEDSAGLLRREVVDAIGLERARAAFTRQGYNAGAMDAEIATKVRPHTSLHAMFSVGPQMHALEGIVLSEQIAFDVNIEEGRFYSEYRWHHSSECAAHLKQFGRGQIAAGWSQIGYASGYASEFLGRPIVYREVECIAMGHECCRIVGRPREEWPDAGNDLRYLRAAPVLLQPNEGEGLVVASRDGSGRPDKLLVGASAGFNMAFEKTRKVAGTQAAVLLLGESGVGKEMFARSLHLLSPRKDMPFIAVNCAAMPETLIEAELFGVEKGAFTGATSSRQGKFERAHGGTIFLDEIGTLSMASQAKLLRVLQEGEVEPIGGSHSRPVDARVVAATNINLREAVARGAFRADLFFRLNVFPIAIPPLRERRADIPVLMAHLLKQFCARHGRDVSGFSEEAVSAMLSYDWPGNVRELENVIERGVIMAQPDMPLGVHDLFTAGEELGDTRYRLTSEGAVERAPFGEGSGTQSHSDIGAEALETGLTLDEIERRILQRALEAHGGNRTRAAAALGLTRAQFNYRLKTYAEG